MTSGCRVFILILMTLAFCVASGGLARAEGLLTVDLAQDHVDISTGFTGSSITLYGIKKQAGDIAVTIRGPDSRMVVRHKSQIMGIWINSESVTFRNVPIYYDYALSKPAAELTPVETLAQYGIGIDALNVSHVGSEDVQTVRRFREALVRNKQTQGHFPLKPRNLVFLNGDFFKTSFYVPPDVPTGQYVVNTYLFQDGKLLESKQSRLRVAQVGFSARLYRFAYRQEFFYGLLSVMLAMMAGWAAHTFLRRD